MRFLFSWLIALALLVMPAIMAPAAAQAHAHGAAVSTAPAHCPDQPSGHDRSASECAMTCAATLPPAEPSAPRELALVARPLASPEPLGLTGQLPAPAIPPPKQA